MSRTASLLIACAFTLPGAAWAQAASATAAAAAAPGVRFAAGEVEVRARVVELDTAGRTATLRGPRGQIVTVAIPPEAKNVDQLRVGDELVVRYLTAVAARLEPVSNGGIRERVESSGAVAAPAGAAPGVAGARTVEVLAVVKALDRKARTVTLQGVHRSVRVNVPEGIDLNKVKLGDEVRAVFSEAVVMSVAPAPKRAPAAAKAP